MAGVRGLGDGGSEGIGRWQGEVKGIGRWWGRGA